MTSIQKLFDAALERISPEDWQNAVKHVIEVENSYWKNDHISDIQIEQVLIKLGEDSETDSECSSDEE